MSRVRTAMMSAAVVMVASWGSANVAYAQSGVIGDTGQQVTGLVYDWIRGRWVVKTQQHVVFDSALDPNRNQIDPGSYQTVNYQKWEGGVLWRYTGARWTSYGRPHSNISRRAISGIGPGLAVHQTQTQTRNRPKQNVGYRRPSQSGTDGAYGNW